MDSTSWTAEQVQNREWFDQAVEIKATHLVILRDRKTAERRPLFVNVFTYRNLPKEPTTQTKYGEMINIDNLRNEVETKYNSSDTSLLRAEEMFRTTEGYDPQWRQSRNFIY